MKLTTPVLHSGPAQWSYATRMIAIGSCFSEHIAGRLQRLGIAMTSNPNGIVFHPSPMADILERSVAHKAYTLEDLVSTLQGWLSFLHHGQFRGQTPEVVLGEINRIADAFHTDLLKADVAIFTLGTAWGYVHDERGHVVANCHKQPSTNFRKELSNLAAMEHQWLRALRDLKRLRPAIQILFTISPVRHTREGMVENQRSKARLIELVHRLMEQVEGVMYFPAYEIMLDELRDYRFYERDMIHPNALAVDIIWERFAQFYFTAESQKMMQEIEQWRKLEEHRGLHESPSEEIQRKQRAAEAIAKLLGTVR